MKRLLSIVFVGVGLMGLGKVFGAAAYPLTLQWQASGDPTVTGYALYYGADGAPLTNRLDMGTASSATLKDLAADVPYSFYVVAYDADQNESAPSNLLLYTTSVFSAVRLMQPADGSMNVSFLVAPGSACHVEYTDGLNPPNWTLLNAAVADTNGMVTLNDAGISTTGSRFYRAVLP